MNLWNRRSALGRMIRVGAAASLGLAGRGRTARPAEVPPDILDRVAALLGGLPGTAQVLSDDLQSLFAGDATLAHPVGPERILLQTPPARALILLPVRQGRAVMDIPVIAIFAGNVQDGLRLLSLHGGPANPLDAPANPQRTAATGDLQQEYDRLVAEGGGVLTLPAGEFATNLVLHSRRVHLSGAGRGATRLLPKRPDHPILRALYREGSWDYVTVANLDVAGSAGRGVGFAAGADGYVPGDEFAGRTRFVNVGFGGLSTCISRDAGQIGLLLDQCTFGDAEVHLHSVAKRAGRGEIMHAGILVARDCHFTGARQAVAHFDSPVAGTGGVLFDSCVMERNPGFVFHVDAFANVDSVTDLVVRECWNEANATASGVRVGGRDEDPVYAAFRDTGMVRFEGTPLGPLRLRNAVVATVRCPLDQLTTIDQDAASTVQHQHARGFGSMVPKGTALSVAAAAQSDPPGRALTFQLAHRQRVTQPSVGAVLMASTGDRSMRLVGTALLKTELVADAILPGVSHSQAIRLTRGSRVFPPPVAIPARHWVVWLLNYRVVAGTGASFQLSGARGISFLRPLDSNKWTTLGGMAEVAPGSPEASHWLIQDGAWCDLLLGGHNLVAFKDRQGALDFLNSGDFARDQQSN